MTVKDNLRSGTAMVAAAFMGIGKGLKVAPGGAAGAVRAEPVLQVPAPAAGQGVTDTLDDDDDAVDNDDDAGDDGEDKPDDSDDDTTASEKRARRRQRKAKRLNKAKEKSKTNETEAEDDDSDADMKGNTAAAKARTRERSRCAAIFACDAAAKNIELAAYYAFNTQMTRQEAIGALEKAPAAAAGNGFFAAMEAHREQRVKPDVPPGAQATKVVAESWDKAFKAVKPF